jgi:hypothetical protein
MLGRRESAIALALSAAGSLAALGLAVAAPGAPDGAGVSAAGAGGALSLSNSRAGAAILAAANLRPGDTTTGAVTIGDDGSAPGLLTLHGGAPADTPGPGGGRLSGRLLLAVTDVTLPSHPLAVYSGTPDGLGDLELGTLAPGADRRFEVAATVPRTGDDDRFQGATLSMGLEWRIRPVPEAVTPGPTATPTPTPTPAPGGGPLPPPATALPAPVTAPPPALPAGADLPPESVGLPPLARCVAGRRLALKLKAPGGVRIAAGTVTVNGKVRARLRAGGGTATVTLRGLPAGRLTVRVEIRAADGRRFTATGTYRSCARRAASKSVHRRR